MYATELNKDNTRQYDQIKKKIFLQWRYMQYVLQHYFFIVHNMRNLDPVWT